MEHVDILFCGRTDRVLFSGRQSSRISVGVRLLQGTGVAKVYTTRSFPKNIHFLLDTDMRVVVVVVLWL